MNYKTKIKFMEKLTIRTEKGEHTKIAYVPLHISEDVIAKIELGKEYELIIRNFKPKREAK